MSSNKQKHELIAGALLQTPGRSNTWIASQLEVSPHTVKKVRNALEETGAILEQRTTLGRDGKHRPLTNSSQPDEAIQWLARRNDLWTHDPLIVRGEDGGFLDRTHRHHVIILVGQPKECLEKYVPAARRLAYHLAILVPTDWLGYLPLHHQQGQSSLERVAVLKNSDLCWLIFQKAIRFGLATFEFATISS